MDVIIGTEEGLALLEFSRALTKAKLLPTIFVFETFWTIIYASVSARHNDNAI